MGEDDLEDCVGPTALLIHVGGSHSPRFVALRHQGLDVLNTIFTAMSISALKSFPSASKTQLILVKYSIFSLSLPFVYSEKCEEKIKVIPPPLPLKPKNSTVS